MLLPGSRGFVLLLGALSAVAAMSTDMNLPTLPTLSVVFNASPDAVQLTFSLFLVGYGASMLVGGPLSDRFGRKPVLVGGLAIFTLASIGCLVSPSLDWLIFFRLVQGVGACVGRVLTPAMVRDLFDRHRGAQMLSYVTQVMALAPLVAPILGGYLLKFADWRAIFGVLTLFGAVLLLVTWRQLRETIPQRDRTGTSLVQVIRNYSRFLAERSATAHMFTTMFLFAGLLAYISGSPFVIIDVFGVGSDSFGFFFALTALALMGSAAVNGRLVKRLSPDALLRAGLLISLLAGLCLFALGTLRIGGVMGIVLPMMLYMIGFALAMPNATAAAMQPLPEMAGLVSSMLGCSQMLCGSLLGYLVGRFYDHTATSMVTAIAVMAVAACLAHFGLLRARGRRPAH
jgi:DHA1 family bicyclomycin/chloramphenicol resistance-like MFS transporter